MLCATILAFTAVAKITTIRSGSPLLLTTNALLPVENGTLYLAVAVVEIVVACCLLFAQAQIIRTALLVWLTAIFSIYHLGLWVGRIQEPCPCLGTGFERWPILSRNLHTVSLCVFFAFVALVTLHLTSTFLSSSKRSG